MASSSNTPLIPPWLVASWGSPNQSTSIPHGPDARPAANSGQNNSRNRVSSQPPATKQSVWTEPIPSRPLPEPEEIVIGVMGATGSGESTESFSHDSSLQTLIAEQSVATKPTAPPPPSEPENIFICVMGATGSGKSSFINRVSGSNLAVGQDLLSCTSEVGMGSTIELFGKRIMLVDTPGFDDTTKSDIDILKMIAAYLSTIYEKRLKLSGVIYMHRISDIRMSGASRRNFSMFRKLCGDEFLKNVVIVTNMWSEVTPEKGAAREAQLRTNDILFKPAIDEGAQMLRHDDTTASAQAILRHLVDNQPQALQIQRELIDEHKDITQTAAGVELDRALAALRETYEAQLAGIQQEREQALAEKDFRAKKELEDVAANLQKNIGQIELDRDRLSQEYAEEKARVDAKMQEIEQVLEAEKLETRGGVWLLIGWIKDSCALSRRGIKEVLDQLLACRGSFNSR